MSVALIDRNGVVVRGVMAAPAEHRELPGGDAVVSFRLRTCRPLTEVRGRPVEVLQCVTFDRSLQRRVAAWQPGDVVEVEGALQRRFWRAPTGTVSAVEVNVRRGRKLPRTPRLSAGATA